MQKVGLCLRPVKMTFAKGRIMFENRRNEDEAVKDTIAEILQQAANA